MARAKANFSWLEAAQRHRNDDSAFRKLGSTDMKLGLVIGDEARLVVFEAFEISQIGDLDPHDVRDVDLVIRMTPRDWNAYLKKRAQGKGPTLLSLDLDSPVVYARNPLKRLLFERFNLSLQMFIDSGARLAAA